MAIEVLTPDQLQRAVTVADRLFRDTDIGPCPPACQALEEALTVAACRWEYWAAVDAKGADV